MRGKPKRLYWDTCVFLAWLKNETCWPEDVLKGIEQTVEELRARSVVIVTSAITMLEILSSQMTKEQKDAFAKVFSDPQLQLIDVDRRIAGKASAIRSYYDDRQFKPDGGVSGRIMGMGDAIHLATAIHHEVLEFQTLDGLSKKPRPHDLLAQDGNVAGARLSIRLPKYVPPPEPLHGPVSTTKGDQTKLSFDLEGQTETHEKESELAPADSNASIGGSDSIAEEMRQEDGPSTAKTIHVKSRHAATAGKQPNSVTTSQADDGNVSDLPQPALPPSVNSKIDVVSESEEKVLKAPPEPEDGPASEA